MEDPGPGAPWSLLAAAWEQFFPLRPQRLEWVLALAPPGARFLDAGCATGSLPRALASRGRVAHGLDLEPAFLDEARRLAEASGLDIPWHQGNLLEVAEAVGAARFDLVTCLGQTLPHLLEERQWIAFFRQVRGILTPGGRLAIQVVHDGATALHASRELPKVSCAAGTFERRRTMLPGGLARMDTVFRPAQGAPVPSQVLHLRMEPGRAAELLREAGLEPEPPMADESGKPFREDSPGWILVAGL